MAAPVLLADGTEYIESEYENGTEIIELTAHEARVLYAVVGWVIYTEARDEKETLEAIESKLDEMVI